MKVPRVTSIFLVALTSLSFLNFVLKYYTYFVLMVSSSKKTAHEINNIAQETGEVPHPHELYVPLLTFIPTKSPVISRPWVLLTSGLIEENFITFGMSFLTIFYLGKYLENMWGSKGFVKFVLANILLGNLSVYIFYVIASSVYEFNDIPPVVVTPMAVIMGLFIAVKQRIPNHYFLFFKGNVRLKINYIPFLLLICCFILSCISEEFTICFNLATVGFVISWVYLRYFKSGSNERQSYLLPFALNRRKSHKGKLKLKKTSTTSSLNSNTSLHTDEVEITGDRTDQFALHTLFPFPLSLLVRFVSSIVFKVCCRYHLLDESTFTHDDGSEDADHIMLDDMDNLESTLFGLSSLRGVEEVHTFGRVGAKIADFWSSLLGSGQSTQSIKNSMDRRRKQALKQFE